MKKLILILPLTLISLLVHAQWTTNGTVTSTGNTVGIGTVSPASSLSLGPSTSNKKLFIYDSGTEASGFGQANAEFRIFGISSVPNHISFGKYQLPADAFTEQMRIDNAGNVGIGTTTPTNLLTLNSTAGASLLLQKGGSAIAALSVDGTSSTWNGGGSIGLNLIATGADISMQTGAPALPTLVIKNNGNVGIGITAPQNKLDVNGTIHSKSVLVNLTGWSDYVFKKDYKLTPLAEVKNYIAQYQHLPEIPSEPELMKKGLDVGEMNKLLMKKVEELTLYAIEQEKQQTELKATNQKNNNEIDLLKVQLLELTNRFNKSQNSN
jgi:hypothetical protein